MRTIGSVGKVLLAVTVLCGTAMGQQIPPIESGPRLVDVTVVDGEIEMRATATGEPLLMRRGMTLFDGRHITYGVRPTTQVQIQPTGFDIIYRFHNNAGEARPMADMRLGVITLGPEITTQDMRYGAEDKQLSQSEQASRSYTYPMNMYSPVTVLRNDRWAVGVSFHYPIMEYKHEVFVSLKSPSGRLAEGEGGRGWEVLHRTSNPARDPDQLANPSSVPPGETRTYVISVRVTQNANEWMRTLTPYREYFHSLYGGVQYERDTTPICAVALAAGSETSTTNPYGFRRQEMRPDLYGWTAWVDDLKARNWPAVMLWLPSGAYHRNQHMNFPFQITTNWLSTPQFATATHPQDGLPAYVATGKELGLWWGRSLQVSRMWEPSSAEQLDPSNPEHVALAFAELDLAVQAGVTMIGLDTFGHRQVPLWKSFYWMKRMQERAPNVKFITEPISCDVMHTIAPTFYRGTLRAQHTPQTVEDLMVVTSPHYMADFLLPGHEICASFSYSGHRQHFGIYPNDAMVQRDAELIASMGYRPIMGVEQQQLRPIHAAETWNETVPADIRWQPDRGGQGGNPGQGSNPGQGGQGSQGGSGNGSNGGQGTGTGGQNPPGGSVPSRLFSRQELREAILRAQGRGGAQ